MSYNRNSAERYRNHEDILAYTHGRADGLGLPGQPTTEEKKVMSEAGINQVERLTDKDVEKRQQQALLSNLKQGIEERKANSEQGVIRPVSGSESKEINLKKEIDEPGTLKPSALQPADIGVIRPSDPNKQHDNPIHSQREDKDRDNPDLKRPMTGQPSDIKGFTVQTNEKGHDEYYWDKTGQLAFIDRGGDISVNSRSLEGLRGALELAKQKEWEKLEAHGTDQFKQVTAVHAKSKDMEVTNVELTPQQAREAEAIKLQEFSRHQQEKRELDKAHQQYKERQHQLELG